MGGPIWPAKVDCTANDNDKLCRSMHVRAFPTMLMFRHGDMHPFEAYHGQRTVDAFIDRLTNVAKGDQLPADKKRMELHKKRGGGKAAALGGEGCNVLSISGSNMDLRGRLIEGWMQSPLNNKDFIAKHTNQTYVHYLKLIAKSFLMEGSTDEVHGYHYSSYSNEHVEEDDIPAVVFQYDLSPISIVETLQYRPFYQFITNFMAIIGGVFAMIGAFESFTHQISKSIFKKRL